jgi:predicted P-loop ATPase
MQTLPEAEAKADAEEQKRLAEEAKEEARKEALESARLTKLRAIQAAKDAEERRRIRAGCGAIYRSTADRKVSDLTVKEEQQVRACQALGLYPPH